MTLDEKINKAIELAVDDDELYDLLVEIQEDLALEREQRSAAAAGNNLDQAIKDAEDS